MSNTRITASHRVFASVYIPDSQLDKVGKITYKYIPPKRNKDGGNQRRDRERGDCAAGPGEVEVTCTHD